MKRSYSYILLSCLLLISLFSCKDEPEVKPESLNARAPIKKEISGSISIKLPERTIEFKKFDSRESGVNFQKNRALYSLRPSVRPDVFMQLRVSEEMLYQKNSFTLEVDNTKKQQPEKFDFFYKEGAADSLNTIRVKHAQINVAELTDSTFIAEVTGAVDEGSRGQFIEKDATITFQLKYNKLDTDER